jgi:hypothetical protein
MKTRQAIGKKCWVVPDGYIPQVTENDSNNLNGYISHECACILNAGSNDAQIDLSIYFEDAEPKFIEGLIVPAQRSWHLRMDQLETDGQPVIERATPYSLIVTSNEPIVVQMSRLDTTQNNMAFLSTMCLPVKDEE